MDFPERRYVGFLQYRTGGASGGLTALGNCADAVLRVCGKGWDVDFFEAWWVGRLGVRWGASGWLLDG